MRVKQIRLNKGCYALKGGTNFNATKHCKIERLVNGDYSVTLAEMDPVVVGAHMVDFAVCVDDSKVPVSELKK